MIGNGEGGIVSSTVSGVSAKNREGVGTAVSSSTGDNEPLLIHKHIHADFDENKLGMREILPARFPLTVHVYGWAILDTEPDRTPILSGGFMRSAKSHRKSTMELLSGSCFDEEDKLMSSGGLTPSNTAERTVSQSSLAQNTKKKRKTSSKKNRSEEETATSEKEKRRKKKDGDEKSKTTKKKGSSKKGGKSNKEGEKKKKRKSRKKKKKGKSSSSSSSSSSSTDYSSSSSSLSSSSSSSSSSSFSDSSSQDSSVSSSSQHKRVRRRSPAALPAGIVLPKKEQELQRHSKPVRLPYILNMEQLSLLNQLGNCLPPEFPDASTNGFLDLLPMSHGYDEDDFKLKTAHSAQCCAPGCTQPACCTEFRSGVPLCGSILCFDRVVGNSIALDNDK